MVRHILNGDSNDVVQMNIWEGIPASGAPTAHVPATSICTEESNAQSPPLPSGDDANGLGSECAATREEQRGQLVITYTNRVFGETALGLQQALLRLGLAHVEVIIWGDMHPALECGAWVDRAEEGECKEGPWRVQIAIAPHEPTLLLPRYVVLHMEQSWSVIGSGQRYLRVLSEALAVWTFSEAVSDYLQSLHVLLDRVSIVPVYTDQSDFVAEDELLREWEGSHKMYAGSFFGSRSKRRADILNPLLESIVQESNGRHQFGGGYFGEVPIISGAARKQLVQQSKIILNVHTEEDSALEVHRLNYLLGQGACIVSERSSDEQLDRQYEDVVVFADTRDFHGVILALLEDADMRKAIQLNALTFAQLYAANVSALRRAVEYDILSRAILC
ncbi:unnamed protein product [Symbiodinium microadriaticum]|nr:unnamed protein product [Symbiodinium microadriaticum]